ncbi:hypothetical protein [Roseimaritima ulvae]|uniref:Secreted protein n=1 Tax=Roseimaritima ulvae TaxID=980254 RepID=A0A5B9QSZ3_9BACT|nr:hypothetical protein [Roseimaritima ulvae]QEG41012.1 hypothetical protein UC8_30300 [Roseimaritima ulvae]
MLRALLILTTAITVTSVYGADDAPAESTILKVYPVGNIVAASAMKSGMGGHTTLDEWGAPYPETMNALDELRGLVDTMCSQKPLAVAAYPPSLSLIVRHTKDGHEEIAQLLESLAEDKDAAIQVECRALYSQSPTELDHSERTEEQQKTLHELLSKKRLTKTETTSLLALLPAEADNKFSLALVPGRRVAWGVPGRPCTAMGRINHKKGLAEVRLDFISDDYAESTPFGTQIVSLADGESAFFHHYCDGGTVVWLVTYLTQSRCAK